MSRWARRLGLAACAALLAVAGAQAQEKLEIFSWWNGDQGSALQALINQFNALYPDVAVTNAAAAVGPGVDAKAGLRTRMLTGDPPDSFQVRGGQDLIGTWVISRAHAELERLLPDPGVDDGFSEGPGRAAFHAERDLEHSRRCLSLQRAVVRAGPAQGMGREPASDMGRADERMPEAEGCRSGRAACRRRHADSRSISGNPWRWPPWGRMPGLRCGPES